MTASAISREAAIAPRIARGPRPLKPAAANLRKVMTGPFSNMPMDQGTAPSMVSSPSPGPPASGTPAPAAKPSADNAKVTQFHVSVARSASRYREDLRRLGRPSCDRYARCRCLGDSARHSAVIRSPASPRTDFSVRSSLQNRAHRAPACPFPRHRECPGERPGKPGPPFSYTALQSPALAAMRPRARGLEAMRILQHPIEEQCHEYLT